MTSREQVWPINDSVTLVQTPIHYIIQFKYPAYALIQSLLKTRIIPGASTDDQYRSITFKAHSVTILSPGSPLSIATIARMLPDLAKQLNHLIQVQSHTLYGLAFTDIILINDTNPAFLGSEWVAPLEGGNMARVSSPFVLTEGFFSPEVLEIRELPASVHFKTAYASLGLWMIYWLIGDDAFYRDYIRHKRLDQCLHVLRNHPVYQTRLYGCLSRCLVEDPAQRCLLLL